MASFKFGVSVPAGTIISSCLGVDGTKASRFQSAYDVGKAVTLGTNNNHVLAAAGAEIDGFVTSVELPTYNQGFSFGGVLQEGRIYVQVGAGQGATAMVVGDYVVADTQLALGTVGTAQTWTPAGTPPSTPTGPTAQVKTGANTHRMWRCIRIDSGAGLAGSIVLLERN